MTVLEKSIQNPGPALGTAASRKPGKIDVLTALRFFAAAAIVLYHLDGMFGLSPNRFLNFPGPQPVSFFFVLSGFILSYVYPTLDRHSTKNFFLARFARLWPTHIATLCLLLAIFPYFRHLIASGQAWGPFPANVLMIHSWIPYPSYYVSFNGPSWSISTEFGFYMLFPLLLWKQDSTWWIKLLLAIGLLGGIIAYCNLNHLPSSSNTTVGTLALVEFNPLGRLVEFVLGMTAATIWQKWLVPSRWTPSLAAVIEVLAVSATIAVMYWNYSIASFLVDRFGGGEAAMVFLSHSGVASFFFAAAISVLALQRGPISRFLSKPLFIVLGEISFSVYLLHQMTFQFFSAYDRAFNGLPPWLEALEVSFLIVILAHLVWLLIERPARRAILHLGSKYLLKSPRNSPQLSAAKSHEPFTGTKWIAMSAFLLCLFLAANYYIIRVHSSIQRASASEAQAFLEQSRSDLHDISFGNMLVLRGVTEEHSNGAIMVSFLWQAQTNYEPLGLYGIHLLDAKGNIIGQLDYVQDCAPKTVPNAVPWIDHIVIWKSRYPQVVSVGLCLQEKPGLDLIDKGPRDWGNHRLLISLKQ